MNNKNRPYVILNAAMSLDGKIATISGDSEFSSVSDWKRVHELRSNMDAIMVGINTILKDNPKLYVKNHKISRLLRVIVDSKARTPPDSKIFQNPDEPGPPDFSLAPIQRAPWHIVLRSP